MTDTELLTDAPLAPDEIEALNAEAEESDAPEAPPEPEAPEAPPEPAAGPTPEDMEARFKKAEKAFATYTGRIRTIFDEQADELTDCPLCAGTVPGFVLIGAAGHLPDETKATVQTYLGIVQEADYPADPNLRTCENCDGLGKIRTGSRVPAWTTLPCALCTGRGYLAPAGTATAAGAHTEAANGAAAQDGPQVPPSEADPWGSPRLLPDGTENPNYGRMPQFKDSRWP